ncbi:MAG: hypothetical protein K2N05_03055 [Muribaculaceae bacterium]|nr:hypothetical protein [Muribaculaceae bacterium]
MKKVLFISLCILASAILFVGCGKTKTEKVLEERTDSIRTADSVAAVETSTIEQARQDSIREDSILRVSLPKLSEMIKVEKVEDDLYAVYFNSDQKISKIFKNLGFKEKKNTHTNKEYYAPDDEYITNVVSDFVWTLDSPSEIKVTYKDGKMIINFDNEKVGQILGERIKEAGFKSSNNSSFVHPKNSYLGSINIKKTNDKVTISAGGRAD